MKKPRNRDMPADPAPPIKLDAGGGDKSWLTCRGLTKREVAAIAAMQGMLAGQGQAEVITLTDMAEETGAPPHRILARMSVAHADALFDEMDQDQFDELARAMVGQG